MPELTECREIGAQREIFIYKHIHLKEVISNMNNVNFHLYEIKKRRVNKTQSKQKGKIIKIRVGINKIENENK